TLYADEQRKKKLAAVTVSMGAPIRELLLDLGVLALAAALIVAPISLVAWAVRLAWRGRETVDTPRRRSRAHGRGPLAVSDGPVFPRRAVRRRRPTAVS